MKIQSLVAALPPLSNTGWGTAGRRIVEEMKKVAFVQNAHDVNDGLMMKQDFPVDFTAPLLQAIRGVDMLPMYPHLRSRYLNVGYCFIEDSLLLKRYAENAHRYWDTIVAGSNWGAERIRDAVTEVDVKVAVQGVDSDIFRPMEEVTPDDNWFTIFSGGKWEFRKGQDVVIAAVKVLMERHKDVRLVASWWNPWQQSIDTMMASHLLNGGPLLGNYKAAALFNGIPPDRVQFIDECSHAELAGHMNKCDIALFPNRCEAGTNLVMMEAMACGLPVITVPAHGHATVAGHLDLKYMLSSKPFICQRAGVAVGQWYEPDLDETIDKLEAAYNGYTLDSDGAANRIAMLRFTWEACAKSLLEACN